MRPKQILAMMTVNALVVVVAPPLRAQEATQRKFDIPRTDLAPGEWPGALSRDNLARPRQKAPFDLTGNWMFSPAMNRDNGVFQYLPLPKVKPAAQASYDEAQAAIKAGKANKNDEGACWPAGPFAADW